MNTKVLMTCLFLNSGIFYPAKELCKCNLHFFVVLFSTRVIVCIPRRKNKRNLLL